MAWRITVTSGVSWPSSGSSDGACSREGCQRDRLDDAVTPIPSGPLSPHFPTLESVPGVSGRVSPPQRKARSARCTAGSVSSDPHRDDEADITTHENDRHGSSAIINKVSIFSMLPRAVRRVDAVI